MNRLDRDQVSQLHVARISKHKYICDLLYLEGPVLSLFRDAKRDWLYLWCDTDGTHTERWLLFPVERKQLTDYLAGESSLLNLVNTASLTMLLDFYNPVSSGQKGGAKPRRSLMSVLDKTAIASYLPAPDSYFDEELTPDISASQQLAPEKFDVPIGGDWFIADLDRFTRLYSQLYSFFYCSKPRFVANIGERVKRDLAAPWRGGASRVNLFESLKSFIPAVHDLRISKLHYNSPGDITFEALESVAKNIEDSVLKYQKNQIEISKSVKELNAVLDRAELRRSDLSAYRDENLPLSDELVRDLHSNTSLIVELLEIGENYKSLCENSPNVVVSTKVLLSLVIRVADVAEFISSGMVRYLDDTLQSRYNLP